jgi:hypothetical protein
LVLEINGDVEGGRGHWRGKGFQTYGWAAQALVVASGAETIEVEVKEDEDKEDEDKEDEDKEDEDKEEVEVEVEDWAATRVKPVARRTMVSFMVYSRESLCTRS